MMVQWVRAPGDLSSIPGTYMKKGREVTPANCPLSSTCLVWHKEAGREAGRKERNLLRNFILKGGNVLLCSYSVMSVYLCVRIVRALILLLLSMFL